LTTLFPIQDLHVHSIYSDGSLSVDEILEIATAKGYTVGIADHASPEDKIVNDAHLLDYLDALERYPVFRSVEMDVELGSDLSAAAVSRLDYVVVGIHFLTFRGVQAFFWDPLAVLPDPEEVVEGYVATAERAMASMRMEILAHPTAAAGPARRRRSVMDPAAHSAPGARGGAEQRGAGTEWSLACAQLQCAGRSDPPGRPVLPGQRRSRRRQHV
jgi:histidinol phosphatase-like PHP family hydrolase